MQSFLRSSLRVSSSSSSTLSLTRYFINNSSLKPGTSTRSVVFARGERIKGAIRDPEEVLSSNGVKYGLNQSNIKPIKEFLNSKSNGKYQLSDELLLQIITHKSFAHGSQPYNEKLSFFGKELLELHASKYVISEESLNEFKIDNINFDPLGSYPHRMITTDRLLTDFAIEKGLADVFFCRLALPNGKQDANYKPKGIYSTITSSLVGAIASQHGKSAAEEFMNDVVLSSVLQKLGKKKADKK